MAKKYDFALAKQIIEENKELITEASLGMQEDWFWTGETVWEDGEFIQNLDEIKEVAGIDGSDWATPIIKLELKDGTTKAFNCYQGKSGVNRNPFLTFGPLSSEVQENMPEATDYEEKKNS